MQRLRYRIGWCVALIALSLVWTASPAAARKKKAEATPAETESQGKSGKTAPASPIDLNTASEKDLTSIPGVGKATARKIVAGRPYSSVADLSKAGISAKTIDKITPMVMVGAGSAPAPAAAPQEPAHRAPRASSRTSAESNAAPAQVPPHAGMVWVNLDSKIFHEPGSRWYGKTKNGKFMSESDALAAGYRPAKIHQKKAPQ